MERIPSAHRAGFLRDSLSVWKVAFNGVTPKTNIERENYWDHWHKYAASICISPFINKTVPPLERDIIKGTFAARVRVGDYGRGNEIKFSGVSDALVAISKTIELAGQCSSLYRSDNKYQLFLERVVEGLMLSDSLTTPQLAITVAVPKRAYTNGLASSYPKVKHIGCLTMMSF